MSKYNPVTHVIFDMDGLLLDTERLYTVATQMLLDEYGEQFTWELKNRQMGKKFVEAAKIVIDTARIYRDVTNQILATYNKSIPWELEMRIRGMNSNLVSRIIIDELNLPLTPDEFVQKSKALHEKLFPDAQFMKGAEKLVHHLHHNNIPICVATGSSEMNYEMKTRKHRDFFSLFHHVVLSGDDPEVTHGKPAPDCFLVAARRFEDNPSPEKVLVFEDATNGALASVAAGMQCVWIPDERADQSQLRDKVTLILKSLEEFKPEDFGLPPYEDSS